ncbi:MAG TPA: hypothetical protein VK191_12240 [Symbiobacteriaceae bacterium]|nr:hypothetical protein [Symbiobacteriaceae bacterium]
MPNLDPSAVGASVPNSTLESSYANRLANQQSATASAPNLFGGQAQPTSSFGADLQSASNGYTQGANAGSSVYGEQGAQNALNQDNDTHDQFKFAYEQNGVPSYNQ